MAEAAVAPLAGVPLWEQICAVYGRALASGACSKTDTKVEFYWDSRLGIEYVLRVATALKAKPQGLAGPPAPAPKPSSNAAAAGAKPGNAGSGPDSTRQAKKPFFNPFLPPDPALLVGPLSASHALVLNKFNVVAHHAIVVTRRFRSQAEPLYADDLEATWRVVQAMPQGAVAFYNCGPKSGRSQPHKHLQVVPLPFADGRPPLAPLHEQVLAAASLASASSDPISVASVAASMDMNSVGSSNGGRSGGDPPAVAEDMALVPLALRRLPYRCYAALLPASPTPKQLEGVFNALLQLCHPSYSRPLQQPQPAGSSSSAADPDPDAQLQAALAASSDPNAPSYNMVLTKQWMMLVPRGAEAHGLLAPNSLAFAGTMLVRSEEELEFVRNVGPTQVLAAVGEPWQ